MTIDDKIRGEKLKYNINKKAAKISALSSGKIDKRQIIEQAKFAHSLLGKALEKQTKKPVGSVKS